jgi:hypothetical protein
MKKIPFKYFFAFLAVLGLFYLVGCNTTPTQTPVVTSTLTSLRMVLPTTTPQPTLTPTVDLMLERPTAEPGAKPTTDPLKLTPVVQSTPISSLTANNVVGISFNEAGDKLIVVQTDGVYFYTVNKMVLDKRYDLSQTRKDPSYLGSTDIFSMSSSPNKEWMVLGQWQHYNSAKGSVQRGILTVLQLGNGYSKILGLDQSPSTMAAPFVNVRYTPDNLMVAGEIDTSNGLVQVWETKGNLLYTLTVFHGLKSLDFSPRTKRVAICSINGDVEVHDSVKGGLTANLGKFTQNISEASCGLTYAHNGSLLAFYGDDQVISLWGTDSNVLTHLPGHNTVLNQIIFSPDDQSLATLGSDSLVRVWNIQAHKETFSWVDPKIGMNWIKYSPDGRYLLGGGSDGVVRIFSPINNQLVAKIEGKDITFSKDGKLMASFDAHGNAWVWQMSSFNTGN